ncbi:hypothetical protein ACTJJ4_00195 [Microbacterium sp. 22195]|uniref:hypothetical protein n=1 Tax=Microbacterium sp. 22195 TaxID=3453891 RepID=UPI003F870654
MTEHPQPETGQDTPPEPTPRMRSGLKGVLWTLLVVWAAWIACSIVALNGSSIRPAAGSSGGMIAFDVLTMAVTGDSSITWALIGCCIFGTIMLLLLIGLLIWYVRTRRNEHPRK